jgi:hypothetical protein
MPSSYDTENTPGPAPLPIPSPSPASLTLRQLAAGSTCQPSSVTRQQVTQTQTG